jgi:hypothetical protein
MVLVMACNSYSDIPWRSDGNDGWRPWRCNECGAEKETAMGQENGRACEHSGKAGCYIAGRYTNMQLPAFLLIKNRNSAICLLPFLTACVRTCTAMQASQAFGANRWDMAQFSDDKEKDKFIKLMVQTAHSHADKL